MVTWRVVPMRWWHIEPIMELEHDLFAAEAWTHAMFWSELAQPQTRHYLTALRDNTGNEEVVGYAGLCVYGDPGPASGVREGWVQTLAVRGDSQRQGLGAAMLDALIEVALQRAADVLCLEVRMDNDSAQQLYARRGFRAIGVRPGYYQPSNTDALTMCKDLISIR